MIGMYFLASIGIAASGQFTFAAAAANLPCRCGIDNLASRRIIGGYAASRNRFPWYMYLVTRNPDGRTFKACGSTLITDRHVITNAHCLGTESDPEKITVYRNQYTRVMNPADRLAVSKVTIHPMWSGRNGDGKAILKGNDIAILELQQPLQFDSTFAPACMPDKDFECPYRQLTAIGLGLQRAPNKTLVQASVLSAVELKEIDCKGIFALDCMGACWQNNQTRKAAEERTRREIICSKGMDPMGENGVCMGDSGGPVIVMKNDQAYLVGMPTAASCTYYVDDILSGLTRVSFYRSNFIEQNISNGQMCAN